MGWNILQKKVDGKREVANSPPTHPATQLDHFYMQPNFFHTMFAALKLAMLSSKYDKEILMQKYNRLPALAVRSDAVGTVVAAVYS